MKINKDTVWNRIDFDKSYNYIYGAFDKPLAETTVSSQDNLIYYVDLCSNLRIENRKLKERIDSLDKELKKKTQEYDELLEEVREC